MRMHRERRRHGLRCLMIELRETEIDVLIVKGLLNSETRHDPHVVRQALYLTDVCLPACRTERMSRCASRVRDISLMPAIAR
jgi:hypothetical protein